MIKASVQNWRKCQLAMFHLSHGEAHRSLVRWSVQTWGPFTFEGVLKKGSGSFMGPVLWALRSELNSTRYCVRLGKVFQGFLLLPFTRRSQQRGQKRISAQGCRKRDRNEEQENAGLANNQLSNCSFYLRASDNKLGARQILLESG